MLKLLLCFVTLLGTAILMVELRQQRLELNHQANLIHDRIEAQQAKLWSQQLQIAVYTAPNAIAHTVSSQQLHMVSPTTTPAGAPGSWIDLGNGPDGDAE